MKKAGALVLSLLICLTLGMSALAAPVSPSTEVRVSRLVVNGEERNVEELIVTPVAETEASSEVRTWLERLSPEGALAELIDQRLAGMRLATLFDAYYTGGTIENVTITFELPGIRAGETVYCIHYHDDAWEVIEPDNVADNQVTVTFDSLSPVGFVVEQDSAAASAAGVSPKTGAADTMIYVIVLALAAAAGAGFSCRKLRRG